MGWFDDSSDDARRIEEGDHEAKFSHELLAGAASFYAMKKFEQHQEENGKPESHELAKELLAGFAGAEVDKLAETKGADWIDREEAKRHAQERAERIYDEQYQN
ncbi:CipC protein [Xylogone sp. PMI_703]|nr:CipC protein [Xylogone sp. PMI_703]